ncbi:P-loop containing nucleoside triphosphate hydrolase protein [Fimicolochytrium jonesii]|uniref:P-loop containing nucleoside triphosphate hydrolase protein n=1 Tax=Fimicolochytrium jonesii TaxID=1396493 RepID=UPI0022FF1E01|nr:P-loop containing nucleoside triphosphate hydrolase protein [Fimicolochytrium jonesii]KAI8820593.1 P-loop containing nucleoside triphosphate hydrolase protein [Fimicolochytrium jonesii]
MKTFTALASQRSLRGVLSVKLFLSARLGARSLSVAPVRASSAHLSKACSNAGRHGILLRNFSVGARSLQSTPALQDLEDEVLDSINRRGDKAVDLEDLESRVAAAQKQSSRPIFEDDEELVFEEEAQEDIPENANATFDSLALSEPTLAAMKHNFKFKHASPVQEAVLKLLPTDKDLLVRAKTGTGKTLAFLIAALESAIARKEGQRFKGDRITVLCISPTRELAFQITAEAEKLLRPHNYRVKHAVGGEKRLRQLDGLEQSRVDFLVATPGRLLDLLQGSAHLREKLMGIETLIFDEADQLLEMGFKDEIEKIAAFLPSTRQTFMFSATLSKQIKATARYVLKPSYDYVDTVPENDVPTHVTVKQTYSIVPYSQQLPVLYDVIRKHLDANPTAKIIVFFPTTRIVAYLARAFNELRRMDVLELHSKLDQNQRSKVAHKFRRATSSVLFTSDVSARGVDYPGVTLVIQMGAPGSIDSYIHRIGRTGRAGATGEGLLILSAYERGFLNALKDEVPIKLNVDMKDADVDDEILAKIRVAQKRAEPGLVRECYSAYIGHLRQNSQLLRLNPATQRQAIDDFTSGVLGLSEPPVRGGFDAYPQPARQPFQQRRYRDDDNSFFGGGGGGDDGYVAERSGPSGPKRRSGDARDRGGKTQSWMGRGSQGRR